jgi:hypothetical protein
MFKGGADFFDRYFSNPANRKRLKRFFIGTERGLMVGLLLLISSGESA